MLQLVTKVVVAERADRTRRCQSAETKQELGAQMYSILVLICSTALSHADCQAKTAVDVVRGPTVDSPMMCGVNAQTMIARTDLVQNDGTEYVKVVCPRAKNAEEWVAEVKARRSAIQ
jgi:small ligand-binding sensory domain FIST